MSGPTSQQLLAAVVVALVDVVAPAVTDEQARSTCRTATQLLRSAAVRLALEGAAVVADSADLRSVLTGRGAVGLVDPAPPSLPTPEAARAENRALRAALVAHLRDAPADPDVSAYLSRSLERRSPWLVDAFTGPRR